MMRLTKMKSGQRNLLILILLVGIVAIVLGCLNLATHNWDFRNNLWGPTHLFVTGRSPYRIDQLFDGSNSVWMPFAITVFSPLGILPVQQATTLWAIMSLLAYLGVVVWSIQKTRPNPLLLAVMLVGMFISPAFVAHVTFGQFSVWAMLIALVLAELVTRKAPAWIVGLLMVIMVTKPQLAFLTGLTTLIVAYRVGQWRLVLQYWGSAVIWAFVLIIPLFIAFPSWIEGLQWAFDRNAPWAHPSLLNLLRSLLDEPINFTVWGVLFVIVVVINVLIAWRMPARDSMRWSLALTVFITPYVWSYDFILLMPILIFTLFNTKTRLTQILWVLGYGAILIYFIYQRVATSNSDDIYWWIPATTLVLVTGITWLDQFRQKPKL
jgi:hypothetical protein